MPAEHEDAGQREALRRYMAHPDKQWEPPAELGFVREHLPIEVARPPERQRPTRAWLLVTGLLVAVALAGGVLLGAVAWSDDRPARGSGGVTGATSPEPSRDASTTPVATPACKTAVDRANTMLASAVKLRGALAEYDRILSDPSGRGLPAGEVLERLAVSRQAGSSESARFNRALESYRRVVDRCELRAP